MVYSFKIRYRAFIASTLAEASEMYCRERDASGEGASTFPSPNLVREGKVIGHISYNGRIWAGKAKDRVVDAKPLYDNR